MKTTVSSIGGGGGGLEGDAEPTPREESIDELASCPGDPGGVFGPRLSSFTTPTGGGSHIVGKSSTLLFD